MKPHNKHHNKKIRIDEVTLVLIVLVLAVIVSVYEKSDKTEYIDAQEITELIFDDHDISFVSNGIIDEYKLKELQQTDYVTLKSQLNAKNDFCVYVEDADGNVIAAKGSSKLKSEIEYCNE